MIDERDDRSGDGGDRIRVALVGCSGVLGDIIRRVVREAPDLYVVTEAAVYPTDGAVVPGDVDVVFWNNAEEEQLQRLLASSADALQPPVLTALDDGRNAVLWRLIPHRTPLGVLSSASLVDWIRSAAAP
jgi:hypothetical protein